MNITVDPTGPQLCDLPSNPVPAGARAGYLKTSDGMRLRYALWPKSEGERRGTVCLVQGRTEFIEKYFETVQDFRRRGFAVATFDWRGQGSSDRALPEARKGHVGHFSEFRHDVEAACREMVSRDMPRPYFALAHSMGGCVALIGAAEGWLPVERLVASTPMVELNLVKRPRLVRVLSGLLSRLGLGTSLVPGGVLGSISTEPFTGNRLSGDPARYARNAAVAHAVGSGAVGSPTISWLRAAFRAMAVVQARGFGPRITIPTLVIGAGDDPVCSTPGIERLASSLGPQSTYLAIPGSRHEVMMESDPIRQAFWRAFDAFIPGSQDADAAPGSAAQQLEDAVVEALVPARDDRAPAGG